MLPPLAQGRPASRGPTVTAVPRAPPALNSSAPGPSPPKRARKDRGPNWLPQEIAALIAAKREMYLQELDTVDGRDLMTPETSKWICVSHCVNGAGYSPIVRDGPACKAKWNQLVPDCKRIADYLSRTGQNAADYWDLSPAERKSEGLPRVYAQETYDAIHEWFGGRPMIQPPHMRDTLASNDGNYQHPASQTLQGDEGDSEPDTEDPIDYTQRDYVQATDDSTPPRSPRVASSTPSRSASATECARTPNSRPYNGLPPGITLQNISSSDTSHFGAGRRPGNTCVKRRNMTGHTVMAEATKATGAAMAQQMQDIAEASRELERSKIEVQLKLFSEQMSYQREKDRRLYENASIANDNARLSILKQGEMVSCLSQLSQVLSQSLNVNKNYSFQAGHQAAGEKDSTSTGAFYAAGTSPKPAYTPSPMNEYPGRPVLAYSRGGIPSTSFAFHQDEECFTPGHDQTGTETASVDTAQQPVGAFAAMSSDPHASAADGGNGAN